MQHNLKQHHKITVYILSDLYIPAFSPRMYAVAKYLRLYGIEPYVFTEKQNSHILFDKYDDVCPTYRIGLKNENKFLHAVNVTKELLWQDKEKRFLRNIKNIKTRDNIPPPDAVISFCYRKFPLFSAYNISKKYGVPLIADCRDIVEQSNAITDSGKLMGPFQLQQLQNILKGIITKQRNKVLRNTDAVITVSQWHKATLEDITKAPVHIIYNGYDSDVFFPKEHKKNATFDIIFTGRLFSKEQRDPTLLIKAFGHINHLYKDVKLIFYTDESSAEIIKSIAVKESVTVDIRPMVGHDKIPYILGSASIISLICNPVEHGGAKGMMSTKIFEALAMQKPILLTTDKNGEAAQLLYKSGRGIATDDVNQAISFIKSKYDEWLSTGHTYSNEEANFVANFDRKKQAEEFANIIYRMIKK